MSVRLPARLELLTHPAAAAGVVGRIGVEVDRAADGTLLLAYTLAHDGRLRVPPAALPGPADGLWAHTCCEAFVAVAGEPGYREFNFSPSGQWAVYDFADYRERIDAIAPPATPLIESDAACDRLQLAARIPAALLPAAAPGRLLMLGLTAVAEDADGRLQYWALRHPAPRPDFHDRRGFALAFAPERP
ncbi:DOMON-like domain-containing protein [Pseudothauera rhizosphaerae]|uniref:DOMON-like domain-containing protein n=1 Tax=Pseudothauera rhizosphaerae TaxID=2565932 RepID=A0A4S4A7Y5_9RHOO|nr:DOMON-like domain-containing protein [Pseudothauera rhizosphaerae]THF54889.1 DOMON-like domain-containing protein [Pseudothauera rhizosphaerae]